MSPTYKLLGTLLFASTCLAQTPVTFLQPLNIGDCQELVTGDFNGDGNLDVACTTNVLSIWLGDGHGHFHQTSQQLPYSYPQVVTGDFNGDGRLDLIVSPAPINASSVIFLPGNGDGTFGAQSTISTLVVSALATIRPKPGGPLALVASASSSAVPLPYPVLVFPGNGDGTFQEPVTTAINSSTNIVTADFNGDGIPDIASSGQIYYNQPLIMQVVLGKSDGSYGSLISTTIPALQPFVAADFNGDGRLDVAWTDGKNNIYTYLGNGDGTFSAGPVTSTPSGTALVAADLNGDGRPDLVMAGMAIALNTGGGNFGKSQWYQNPSGPGGVAGDFRHAGVQDLIVAGDYYQNTGAGTFHSPRSYPAGCTDCGYVAAGDFNNDGNLDAAVAAGSHVRVFAGTGGGQFSGFRATTLTLPHTDSITAIAAADFVEDGKLDLALGAEGYNPSNGEVLVLPGLGNGSFGTPIVAYNGNQVYATAAADVNRSGHLGLIVGTASLVIVLSGNGAGGFTTTSTIKGIANPKSLVVADFNRDGIPDFATPSDVYLGNGDGTFHHAYTLAESWDQVFTGDFNGDGIPDLLTFGYISGTLAYWPGAGDGTFGLPVAIPDSLSPELVADLNGDGISDIVTDGYNNAFNIYLGKGDGNFYTEVLNTATPSVESHIAAGHFTQSGNLDLLFVSSIDQVLVLINSTKEPLP